MTLDLPPISRSAPQGAHTAKSNLVRPSAAHRGRKRRGGRAAGLGGRFVPSPRPSLRGKGARGHESAAAGNRLRAGRGFSHRTAVFYWADPFRTANRTRSAYKGASTASRIHHPRTEGGAGGGRKTRRRSCRRPGGNPAADRRRRTHAQERARGRGTRGRGTRGVRGGLSGPGPAVRAAREAAGGARPPGGYPGVSSSGPRPLHA
jgi:hypothetical protein